jgi:hypothetical protein
MIKKIHVDNKCLIIATEEEQKQREVKNAGSRSRSSWEEQVRFGKSTGRWRFHVIRSKKALCHRVN